MDFGIPSHPIFEEQVKARRFTLLKAFSSERSKGHLSAKEKVELRLLTRLFEGRTTGIPTLLFAIRRLLAKYPSVKEKLKTR